MGQEKLDLDWGDWMLGDLVDATREVAVILSPSSKVVSMEVAPPLGDEVLPLVRVYVENREDSIRMQAEVRRSEFLVNYEPFPTPQRWACSLAGVRLEVRVDGALQ